MSMVTALCHTGAVSGGLGWIDAVSAGFGSADAVSAGFGSVDAVSAGFGSVDAVKVVRLARCVTDTTVQPSVGRAIVVLSSRRKSKAAASPSRLTHPSPIDSP